MIICLGVYKYVSADSIVLAQKPAKRRHMVITCGGPASGKGFFVGEPEKYSKEDVEKCKKGAKSPADEKECLKIKKKMGKLKPGTGYGRNLPKNLPDIFRKDDVPKIVSSDESDRHLRNLQHGASRNHYSRLGEAHRKGKKEFEKALMDHWYYTKDGKRSSLSSSDINYDDFPDTHRKFHRKAKDFYVSMRGWHDDAIETDNEGNPLKDEKGKVKLKINPETGKPKERFKDEARKLFDTSVERKIQTKANDFLVVDSAGEDIDVQNFKHQIDTAKAAGYEVTVIFLDIDKDDAKLSNMSRGFVKGKRMVDEHDIDNFYDKYEEGIKKIKEAEPHRFLHLKRKPPLTEEEKEKLKKLMLHTELGPTSLSDPDSSIKTLENVRDKNPQLADLLEKQIQGALYKPKYTLNPETSKLANGDRPKKPISFDSPEHIEDSSEKKDQKPEEKDEKELKPDEYHKVHDRCPDGWHWDGKHCVESEKKAASYLQKKGMPMGWLENYMRTVTTDIKRKLPPKLRGYNLSFEDIGGDIHITLKGGGSDISALKRIRERLDKIVPEILKKHSDGDVRKYNISAANKGEDLIVSVEIHFP